MFYIRFFTIWNIKLHISLTSAKSCAFCTSNGVRWGTMKQSQQLLYLLFLSLPTGNYMFKVNNRNPRTRCEICSKLTIKTPERRQWRRSGVVIVNFERISPLPVFLLLTLSGHMPAELCFCLLIFFIYEKNVVRSVKKTLICLNVSFLKIFDYVGESVNPPK